METTPANVCGEPRSNHLQSRHSVSSVLNLLRGIAFSDFICVAAAERRAWMSANSGIKLSLRQCVPLGVEVLRVACRRQRDKPDSGFQPNTLTNRAGHRASTPCCGY